MPPRLLTLGQLRLDGSDFRREKPLLLLAYLCLNGSQARRSVARQFWPDAANPMNSLSVAVAQLRRAAPDPPGAALIEASELQVGSELDCDAQTFRAALHAGELETAQALYRGPFLADLSLSDLSPELEEWIMATREELADAYRGALLGAAREAGTPQAAAAFALEASHLSGTTPPTPAQLREVYGWLISAGHPDAERVRREAQEVGLTLNAPEADAAPLLGRERELERLRGLKPGETLWVCGASGLGKSALLRAAARGGTLLQGRSGRPFLTLAALAGDVSPTTPEGWLDLLRDHSGPLLLDDWEAADADSRRVLLTLAQSHAGPPLIISSRERSALGSSSGVAELLLRPVAPEALDAKLYARSGGLPLLIQAVQRGASLPEAVAAPLATLTPRARQLLACLALQDAPNAQITRAALDFSPGELADTLDSLGRAGWISGVKVGPRAAVQAWLTTQPGLEAELLTLLAPHLSSDLAWPLYSRAHELTGSSELPGFQTALHAQALNLLKRGQDQEAQVLLADHARSPETRLLHARALDTLGHYPQAMKLLDTLEAVPLVQACRGRVLFRLGRISEAHAAATDALSGDLEARAHGHNLLGALALGTREYAQAKSAFERATGLFLLRGDELGRLNSLCNQAIAMTELGQDTAAVLEEILGVSRTLDHPRSFLNIGWLLERQDDLHGALDFYSRAAALAETLRHYAVVASAWNNVGVVQGKLGQDEAAERAYQSAMQAVRRTGEVKLMAAILGNLAELQDSLPLIEEAIILLRSAGEADLVAYFEAQRAAFMARSGGL